MRGRCAQSKKQAHDFRGSGRGRAAGYNRGFHYQGPLHALEPACIFHRRQPWLVQVAHAAEGMWVPQQLPEIAGPLQKAGLKLSPEQLANLTGDPMGAVVALGGCTASFVSPQAWWSPTTTARMAPSSSIRPRRRT